MDIYLPHLLFQISSDFSIIDVDIPFSFVFAMSSTMNAYSSLGVVATVTWQVLFVAIPMIYLTVQLQVKHHFTQVS